MNEHVRALFVGLSTIDVQFFVKGHPEPNTKVKSNYNEVHAGGPATNAAITCAFLGAETTLVSPIGKHPLSEFCLNDIVNNKVNLVDPIRHTESKPVFASIITNEINGDRTVFSYHPENNNSLLNRELQIPETGLFHTALFDGFYPEISIPLIKSLKKTGVTTVLDGGSWKPGIEDLLPYVDIAICSNDFMPPGAITKSDVAYLLHNYGVKNIAITRGNNPVELYAEKKHKQIPVQKLTIADTLGAGDVFHGAFCYYYACTREFEQAIQNSAFVASFSCQHKGTRSWMKHYKNSAYE